MDIRSMRGVFSHKGSGEETVLCDVSGGAW